MQITLKLRPGSRENALAVVREAVAGVNADLEAAVEVTELFPGITAGNRAGIFVVRVDAASAADAKAVLQALRDRDDVVYAETARGRTAR